MRAVGDGEVVELDRERRRVNPVDVVRPVARVVRPGLGTEARRGGPEGGPPRRCFRAANRERTRWAEPGGKRRGRKVVRHLGVHQADRRTLRQVQTRNAPAVRSRRTENGVAMKYGRHREFALGPRCAREGESRTVRGRRNHRRVHMPVVQVDREMGRIENLQPLERLVEQLPYEPGRKRVLREDVTVVSPGVQRQRIQDVIHVHRRAVVPWPEGVIEDHLRHRGDT